MNKKIRIVLTVLAICVIIGIIVFIAAEAMVIAASEGDATSGADYIVVLGAKVNNYGGVPTPSSALADRLRAALSYLQDNPQTLAILSGGQGPDEPETEAACMMRWLSDRGISEDRLIPEENSTNTRDNIGHACELIGEDWRDKHIVIVSSEYHLCRAKYLGRKFFDYDFETLAAPTSLKNYKCKYFVREALGMVYTALFYR